MLLMINSEKIHDALPESKLTKVVDHQTKEWYGSLEMAKEDLPWWFNRGSNHKFDLENCELSRDMEQDAYVYEAENLDFLNDLNIDVAIVTTCLTHEGKNIKMIMEADYYSERY